MFSAYTLQNHNAQLVTPTYMNKETFHGCQEQGSIVSFSLTESAVGWPSFLPEANRKHNEREASIILHVGVSLRLLGIN